MEQIDYKRIVKLRKDKKLRIIDIALLTGLTKYTVAKIINQNGLHTSKGIIRHKNPPVKSVDNYEKCIEVAKSLNKRGIGRIGLDKLAD